MLRISQLTKKTSNNPSPVSDSLLSTIKQANGHSRNAQMVAMFAKRLCLQNIAWSLNHTLEEDVQQLITEYVFSLPANIENFRHRCCHVKRSDIASETDLILNKFFDQTCNTENQIGLMGILDKVYFSHRFLEEINDHMMCVGHPPTLAWNMTNVNLLIHQLLGEQYGDRLDQTAVELADKVIKNPRASVSVGEQKSQTKVWPCFCEQFGVTLGL